MIIESSAENAFRQSGQIYHLYTKPLETDVFCSTQEENNLVINYLAIAISKSECKLFAYAIMSNHFHFIVEGNKNAALDFYDCLRKYLDTYYIRHGKGSLMKKVKLGITEITSLKQLRNEIAYVIRNPFVVRNDVNVFACPLTSAHLYFNPFLIRNGMSADKLSQRAINELTKSRTITSIDGKIYFDRKVAQAWSFVDYQKVESFYDNARQFIFSVIRNVEGQVELALSYDDTNALCDEELMPHIFRICEEEFKVNYPSKLDDMGRKKLAIIIKNKYHSSNKQLSRLVKLPQNIINQLFPLSAKS